MTNAYTVSVPGRICLFGEHQDYLKLPVVTAAIDLRVSITGAKSGNRSIFLDLPDIGSSEEIPVQEKGTEYPYLVERDYFRSVLNVLGRKGLHIDQGCRCRVSGNIPINSGTSSSSALIVAWMRLLLELYDPENRIQLRSPEDIAKMAYFSEVEEFGEPGGMMDHYAAAVGGLLYQEFNAQVDLEKLDCQLGHFVLGDSRQPKDTKGILKRVKVGVLDAVKSIRKAEPEFDLRTFPADRAEQLAKYISTGQKAVLEAALINRDITREAKKLMRSEKFDHHEFGRLLNYHQEILDKKCDISTPKINTMLSRSIEAGAYGGKINGSGGGGCMFVYAPDNPERIAEIISECGGTPYVIKVDEGMTISHK